MTRAERSTQPNALAGRTARGLVLAATVLLQAGLLLPELARAVHPLNDDAFHIAAALRVRDALLKQPATALDPWFSYWSLGYPVLHAYQPLAHLVTGSLGVLASGPAFVALFQWLKLLLLLAFPLAIYVGARWLDLGEDGALAAAAVAPLVATDGLYGFEYGSYLWRGTGLYTQLWAMVLLPLALGRSWRALRGGEALGAGTLLAMTFLAHTVCGYVALLSLALAALLLGSAEGWWAVVRRAGSVLGVSAAWVAFFVLPMLRDSGAINRSRWEPSWKFDSFGHSWVLSHLIHGELFDHARLPALTVLLALGLGLVLRPGAGRGERFVGCGFLAWLAVYFGRPTWGSLLVLIGASRDVPLHRLIGAVHLFGILLSGLALGRTAKWLAARGAWLRVGAPVAVLIVLLPAAVERVRFVRQGLVWLRASEAAVGAAATDLDALRHRLDALAAVQPGRVYPGLAAGWGGAFKVGEVRVFDLLSLWQMDAVAFLFHAMSLPSDVMVEFDENRIADYDALDVRYVVMDRARRPPPFLVSLDRIGRFELFEAPSRGRIGIGRLGFAAEGGRDDVYPVSSAWLRSDLPARRIYGLLGGPEVYARGLPALRRGAPLPHLDPTVAAPAGAASAVRREGDDWTAEVEVAEPAVVVLKETYHPGWEVRVDERVVPAFSVTPGFVAAEIAAGRHRVAFRYRPDRPKLLLCLLGPGVCLLWFGARRLRRGRAR